MNCFECGSNKNLLKFVENDTNQINTCTLCINKYKAYLLSRNLSITINDLYELIDKHHVREFGPDCIKNWCDKHSNVMHHCMGCLDAYTTSLLKHSVCQLCKLQRVMLINLLDDKVHYSNICLMCLYKNEMDWRNHSFLMPIKHFYELVENHFIKL